MPSCDVLHFCCLHLPVSDNETWKMKIAIRRLCSGKDLAVPPSLKAYLSEALCWARGSFWQNGHWRCQPSQAACPPHMRRPSCLFRFMNRADRVVYCSSVHGALSVSPNAERCSDTDLTPHYIDRTAITTSLAGPYSLGIFFEPFVFFQALCRF
jgi:hypothetical protein